MPLILTPLKTSITLIGIQKEVNEMEKQRWSYLHANAILANSRMAPLFAAKKCPKGEDRRARMRAIR